MSGDSAAAADEGESFDAAGLLEGFHGMLADHIHPVDESFATAIQVIVGNKLWHYVGETRIE